VKIEEFYSKKIYSFLSLPETVVFFADGISRNILNEMIELIDYERTREGGIDFRRFEDQLAANYLIPKNQREELNYAIERQICLGETCQKNDHKRQRKKVCKSPFFSENISEKRKNVTFFAIKKLVFFDFLARISFL
jgi:hypothetical protein